MREMKHIDRMENGIIQAYNNSNGSKVTTYLNYGNECLEAFLVYKISTMEDEDA